MTTHPKRITYVQPVTSFLPEVVTPRGARLSITIRDNVDTRRLGCNVVPEGMEQVGMSHVIEEGQSDESLA